MTIAYTWRGEFVSDEVNHLHAEAFEHRVYSLKEWDWRSIVGAHSLGWVTARLDEALVGFVNVPWDGFVHAWIQDLIVSTGQRGLGIGSALVGVAVDHARDVGCEWLHVDFDDHMSRFYIETCGFTAARAGLISLV